MTATLADELFSRPMHRPRGRDRARHRQRPGAAGVGAAGIGVVAALVLVLAGLAAQLAGYRAMVISSGSMQPRLSVGDLVVSRSTPAGRLHPGDIVTFHDPALGNRFVTHRVVTVAPAHGQVSVQTKGDANLVPERWAVSDSAPVGLLVAQVPTHGEWLLLLQSGWARIALVSLLCGWLLLVSLRRIWAAAL